MNKEQFPSQEVPPESETSPESEWVCILHNGHKELINEPLPERLEGDMEGLQKVLDAIPEVTEELKSKVERGVAVSEREKNIVELQFLKKHLPGVTPSLIEFAEKGKLVFLPETDEEKSLPSAEAVGSIRERLEAVHEELRPLVIQAVKDGNMEAIALLCRIEVKKIEEAIQSGGLMAQDIEKQLPSLEGAEEQKQREFVESIRAGVIADEIKQAERINISSDINLFYDVDRDNPWSGSLQESWEKILG